MPESYNQLCERLRKLRLARGLTQEQFAEEAGFSYKYYQALEAGRKQDLRLSTLERLAHGHEMPLWELLYEDRSQTRASARQSKKYKQKRPRRKK